MWFLAILTKPNGIACNWLLGYFLESWYWENALSSWCVSPSLCSPCYFERKRWSFKQWEAFGLFDEIDTGVCGVGYIIFWWFALSSSWAWSTAGFVFQKYMHSSFYMKMVLTCGLLTCSWSMMMCQREVLKKCSDKKLASCQLILSGAVDIRYKSWNACGPVVQRHIHLWVWHNGNFCGNNSGLRTCVCCACMHLCVSWRPSQMPEIILTIIWLLVTGKLVQ